MTPNTEYARTYREKQRAAGLCAIHSKEELPCPQCHARYKERSLRLKSEGLCICGQPRAEGRASCERCLDRYAAQQRKQTRRRKQSGMCTYGGCAITPQASKTLCDEHLARLAENNTKLYKGRLAKGLCRQCGLRPRLYGDAAHCVLCREKLGRGAIPVKMRSLIRRFWRLDRIDQRRAQAEAAISHLPDARLREIVSLRQGLIDGVDHTLESIGGRFGVTRERIRQMESKAYRWLLRQSVPIDLIQRPTDIQRPTQQHAPRKPKGREQVKWAARHAVTEAIRTGRLIRQPCGRCGDPKSVAHHTDYSKKLEVIWVCHKHHAEAHGKKIQTKKKTLYEIPCWLANAKPSNELYDAPAIVKALSDLWIKQQQVIDVTGLHRSLVQRIVNGEPVEDKHLGRMLRYIEALKTQQAA